MIEVEFKDINLSEEVDSLYYFIFDCGDWNKYVFKNHPKLIKVKSLKLRKDRIKFIKSYVINYWAKNKKAIEKSKKAYEKNWRMVENKFFSDLEDIVGTQFPKNKKILANISINPICPRFLDKWSFNIFYKFNIKRSREIIMHECCHFLYFKKWKEMFPDSREKTFDSPHIVWHLSELAAPIILNDPRIQNYLKQRAGFYEEHERIKIGTKTAPEFFSNLYRESDGFEDFIKKSYEIIKNERKNFLF